MSLQTMGINMVVRGASSFVRSVRNATESLWRYSNTLKNSEGHVTSALNKRIASLERTYSREKAIYEKLIIASEKYNNKIRNMINIPQVDQSKINQAKRNIAEYGNSIVKLGIDIQSSKRVITDLESALRKATNAISSYGSKIDVVRAKMKVLEDAGKTKTITYKKLEAQLKSYQSQMQIATASITRLTNSLNIEKQRLAELSLQKQVIITRIKQLRDELKNLEANQARYNQVMEQAKSLSEEVTRIDFEQQKQYEKLLKIKEELNTATQELINQNNKYKNVLDVLVSVFNVLTKGYANNIVQSQGLARMLEIVGLKATAATLALDTMAIVLSAVTLGISAVIAIGATITNLFKKLIDLALKLGSALLKFVVEGFKNTLNWLGKLVQIPFNFIIKGLTGIWESIKRIGEIAIGMNLSNLIWNFGTRIKDLGTGAFEAAGNFQLLQIRLRGLFQREMSNAGIPFSDSIDAATKSAQELSYWISDLAVKSIFDAETIANVLTLSMSYDVASEDAKKLTYDIVRFATGMGLGNEQIVRIVENFGQMKAAGKITGTELRDLSRGAFLPVNRILTIMGESLGLSNEEVMKLRANMRDLNNTEGMDITGFFEAFSEMVGRDFPNSIENASASFEVVKSNINDFIESVIGWRVIKPALDIISERMSKFVQNFMNPEFRKRAEELGTKIANFFTKLFELSDKLNPSLKKLFSFFTGSITGKPLKLFSVFTASFGTFASLLKKTNFAPLKWLGTAFEKIGSGDFDSGAKMFDSFVASLIAAIQKDGFWETARKMFGALWTAVKPEVEKFVKKVWESFKEKVKEWWDSSFLPFWEETVLPWIAVALNKIARWVQESTFAKETGENIVNSIAAWFAANGSYIAQVLGGIASIIGSALSIALAQAIQLALGALNAQKPVDFGGSQSVFTGITENDGMLEGGEGGPNTKMQSPLQGIIDGLRKTARKALDESLIELKQWAIDTIPGFGALAIHADVIGIALKSIANSADRIAKAFGGGDKDMKPILDAIAFVASDQIVGPFTRLSVAAAVIAESIANAVEKVREFYDYVQENKANFEAAFNWSTKALGIDQFITDTIALFLGLADELVGHSIIPDMMDDIYESITSTLNDILGWVPGWRTTFVGEFSGIDLFSSGVNIIQTLWDGLLSLAGQLLAWWAGVKAQFTITPTVVTPSTSTTVPSDGASILGSGVSGGSGDGAIMAARGLNMVVPNGYNKDDFIVGVSSGEHVIVIPKIDVTRSRFNKGGSAYSSFNTMNSPNISNNNTRNNQYNFNVNAINNIDEISRQYYIMRLLEGD